MGGIWLTPPASGPLVPFWCDCLGDWSSDSLDVSITKRVDRNATSVHTETRMLVYANSLLEA